MELLIAAGIAIPLGVGMEAVKKTLYAKISRKP
mgnify:CR=1 FL=1